MAGLLCCVATGLAPDARAGTYDVWSCRLPDGRPTGIDGWRPLGGVPPAVTNLCRTGQGLHARLDPAGDVGYREESGWVFQAPPDTDIHGFRLQRAVAVSGERQYHLYLALPPGTMWPPARQVSECITWVYPCPRIDSDLANPRYGPNVLHRSGLTGVVGLVAALDCRPRASQVCPKAPVPRNGTLRIWSSRITLEDGTAPAITALPTGSLFSGQPVSGVQEIRFKATDSGSGIRSIGLLVDGVPVGNRLVDPASVTCQPPYTKVVPCALAVQPTLALDTRELPNGPHSVRVTVTDVAGNVTQSDPYTVVVRNGGQPNGANASRTAKLEAWFASNRARTTSATVRYGQKRTIQGRLTTADGRPITAAVLDLSATGHRTGAMTQSIGRAVTNRAGRFKFRLPSGASRVVRIAYRADTLDEAPVATATLTFNVQAAVTLMVTPKRVRNGDVATFKGRLRGGPGQFGTQVTIQALGARTVATVRADRRGQYSYRYRFGSIARSTRFRFKAVVKAQPNYPYAPGASPTVSVRARP